MKVQLSSILRRLEHFIFSSHVFIFFIVLSSYDLTLVDTRHETDQWTWRVRDRKTRYVFIQLSGEFERLTEITVPSQSLFIQQNVACCILLYRSNYFRFNWRCKLFHNNGNIVLNSSISILILCFYTSLQDDNVDGNPSMERKGHTNWHIHTA